MNMAMMIATCVIVIIALCGMGFSWNWILLAWEINYMDNGAYLKRAGKQSP